MDVEKRTRMEIKRLVDKYNKVVSDGRVRGYNEERTKQEFILPFFRALGWDTENSKSEDEVVPEERVSRGRVDYAFRIHGIPKFFLEAKSLKADLNDPKYAQQAINYSWHKGCTWAVLTDFESVKIFNAEWRTENPLSNHVKTIGCNEFLDRFSELWLLSKTGFEDGLLDKEAEKWGKKIKKLPVGAQMLDDMVRWREILTKNILSRNADKKLQGEEIDEAVQRILDRLIFIRVCEDKGLESPTLLGEVREWEEKWDSGVKLVNRLRAIFKYFEEKYDSELFDHHLSDDLIIDNPVLAEVIKGLHQTKDGSIHYDFSAIDADVLGSIYEQYLGYILKVTQKRAKVLEKHAHRKVQGIYYTPTYIVDYIVRHTLGELLKSKEVPTEKIRVLDPACGSGSFVIKAFDILSEYYKKKGLNLDNILNYKEILSNNIYGVDLDPKAVEITRLNLLLKAAEKRGRLPTLRENIRCGNSLIDDSKVAGEGSFKWEEQFKEIMKGGGFDVVIGNPPYIRIQTLDKQSVDFFNSSYKAATKNYDIYALFVERGLRLLKEGGILGFILPSKFFNADYGAGLRKIIAENGYLHKVVDFKDFQVFEGATTYTCLLFLKKSNNETFDYFELTEAEKLKQSKKLLDEMFEKSKLKHPISAEPWNFVSGKHDSIMEKLSSIKTKLDDISENIFQGIITGADKIYILIKKSGDSFYSLQTNKTYRLEKMLLYPLLKGSKHIRRYAVEPSEKYVIFPYKIENNKATPIPETTLKNQYPNIYGYLLENKSILEKRDRGKMKGPNWYLFSRTQNLHRFGQEKIMTPSIAKNSSFTYDLTKDCFFVGSGGGGGGAYGITLKDKGLYSLVLAIVNSSLISYFIRHISSEFRGGFYAFNKQYIEAIPIIVPRDSERRELEKLATNMLDLCQQYLHSKEKRTDKGGYMEQEINRINKEVNDLVYKIYGITEEEKKIIEESSK